MGACARIEGGMRLATCEVATGAAVGVRVGTSVGERIGETVARREGRVATAAGRAVGSFRTVRSGSFVGTSVAVGEGRAGATATMEVGAGRAVIESGAAGPERFSSAALGRLTSATTAPRMATATAIAIHPSRRSPASGARRVEGGVARLAGLPGSAAGPAGFGIAAPVGVGVADSPAGPALSERGVTADRRVRGGVTSTKNDLELVAHRGRVGESAAASRSSDTHHDLGDHRMDLRPAGRQRLGGSESRFIVARKRVLRREGKLPASILYSVTPTE